MADGDLTTPAVVKEYLQKESIDTDQDPIIDAAITAASETIRTYLERKLGMFEAAAEHVFELDNTRGFLSLAPYDLRELTSILIDTDQGSGSAIDPQNYRLYPRDRELGVWTYLKFRGIALGSWGVREITIAGSWGIKTSELPKDVQHWTTIAVVEWIRSDVSMFTTTFDAVQERVIRPEALPSAVRAGLSSYARRADF